jgi:uncharacterized protein YqeY
VRALLLPEIQKNARNILVLTKTQMTLKEQINSDLLNAMKAKEEIKVGALRMLKAAIMKYEVSGADKVADDETVLSLIQREIKSRKDSYEQFIKGNRPEMAEKEQKEIEFLSIYLPAQLSDDELKKIVEESIKEAGAEMKSDSGKVMKVLMPKVKGKADGAVVSQMVQSLLK